MPRAYLAIAVLAFFTTGTAGTPSLADVIAKDQGIYEKETWNIQKRYDDLDDPTDAPGIITQGRDPADPPGPATDFRKPPGSQGLDYDAESDRKK